MELPDPLFDALQEAASASGTTPIGWIAAHLPISTPSMAPNGAKTLADLFAGRVGLVESSGDEALSENCGERFTDYLEQKRKEGRL
ncbi:MAG: hypothetical protein WD468_03405 [Pirellulales bacterium]